MAEKCLLPDTKLIGNKRSKVTAIATHLWAWTSDPAPCYLIARIPISV